MKFTVTPDDFLKGQLVSPGWHPSQIIKYEEKMSEAKTDPKTGKYKEASQYAEIQFKITDGPSKGTVIYQNFSEKAPSFIVPLMEALGAKVDRNKGFSGEVSASTLVGKVVDIMIVRGSYNNKPKNEIDGYRPYTGKGASMAPAQAGV